MKNDSTSQKIWEAYSGAVVAEGNGHDMHYPTGSTTTLTTPLKGDQTFKHLCELVRHSHNVDAENEGLDLMRGEHIRNLKTLQQLIDVVALAWVNFDEGELRAVYDEVLPMAQETVIGVLFDLARSK